MSSVYKDSIKNSKNILYIDPPNIIRYYNANKITRLFLKAQKRPHSTKDVSLFISNFLSLKGTYEFNACWEKYHNKNEDKLDLAMREDEPFSLYDWIARGAIGIKIKKCKGRHLLFNEALFLTFSFTLDFRLYFFMCDRLFRGHNRYEDRHQEISCYEFVCFYENCYPDYIVGLELMNKVVDFSLFRAVMG